MKTIESQKRIVLPLFETNPELEQYWDFVKNNWISPDQVSKGCKKRVCWKCDAESDHRWEMPVYSIVRHPICPYCNELKAVGSNCLARLYPDLTKQWYYPLNGDLTPHKVTGADCRCVYWKCPKGEDHIWEAMINRRARGGTKCPVCDGKKAVPSNCLSTLFPHLVPEWHKTLNNGLTPNDVTPMSGKKIWWQCLQYRDHIWETMVWHRVKVRGDNLGSGCPFCKNRKTDDTNSLATVRPDLAAEWHKTLNGTVTIHDVVPGSTYRAYWKCDVADDHVWRTPVHCRAYSSESGCHCCWGRKVVKSNCLSTTHPEVAAEWHKTKNGDKTPDQVTYATNQRIWWQCSNNPDHVWQCFIYVRTKGEAGCPTCASSKGEKAIRQFLENLNVKFIPQYRIKECRSTLSLPFDFAVFDDDNDLQFLVEFQGRQHYEAAEFFGGVKDFIKRQKHDLIKSRYCSDNHIPLLVIPHWEFDLIQEKINTFLRRPILTAAIVTI